MDESERMICSRIRSARKQIGLSQIDVAEILGESRDRIASVEYGRTPLPYRLGEEICSLLGISQRWLVEGIGPQNYYVSVSAHLRRTIPDKMLYSRAYRHFLKRLIDAVLSEVNISGERDPEYVEEIYAVHMPRVGISPEELAEVSAMQVQSLALKLPQHLFQRFFSGILDLVHRFEQKHRAEIRNYANLIATERTLSMQNKPLHKITLKSKSDSVSLESLLKRLRAAASGHGKKSALARELGVSPARITEWLSGEKMPGGSTTLTLLDWVEAEEDKQKNSGAVTTRAGAKTQKDTNEKRNQSDPPKQSRKKLG